MFLLEDHSHQNSVFLFETLDNSLMNSFPDCASSEQSITYIIYINYI